MSYNAALSEHLVSAPLDEILETVSKSIINTQEKLNQESMAVAQRMAGADPDEQLEFGTSKYSLLELGFVPEFYQLGETNINLKMAMQLERANNDDLLTVTGSLLSENYTSRYGFDPLGASEVSVKLVPSSVPNVFEKRVAQMLKEYINAAFLVIREYVINADLNSLTILQLERASLHELVDANLSDYKAKLQTLHPDEMPDVGNLQQIITKINALVVIRTYILANDLRPMMMTELYATGVINTVDQNLAHYRRRLNELNSLNNVDLLQIAVEQTNAIANIINYVLLSNLDSITFELLEDSGVSGLVEANLATYQTSISNYDKNAIEELTLVQLQTLLD